MHIPLLLVFSLWPFGKSKYNHISIKWPISNFWVAKPKKLKVIFSPICLNLFTCLKDNFISNFLFAAFNSPLVQVNGSDLAPFKVKSSSFPSLITLCSIINDCLSNSPPYLHTISTLVSASLGGKLQMTLTPVGKVNGIVTFFISVTSAPIVPVILKVPWDSQSKSTIDSVSNIVGTFTLFSGREKSRISPLRIAR